MVKRVLIASVLTAVAFFCLHARPARATCLVAHTFVTGEVITASNLNANPVNEVNCINNVQIFASNIVPTTAAQATFGGNIGYTFPVGVSADGQAPPNAGFACGSANTIPCNIDAYTGNTTTTGFSFNSTTACHAAGDTYFKIQVNGGNEELLSCGGVLTTTGAQACGTPAGYHVECTSGSAGSVNCSANSTCNTNITLTFTTAYAGTPTCTLGNNNSLPYLVPLLISKGTTSAVFSMFNTSGTNVSNITIKVDIICIGV